MTPRNTNTGGVLEAMVVPAMGRGGYVCEKQVRVGVRCGGGTHQVDAVARKDGEIILVSMKWQQTGGTAEQKDHLLHADKVSVVTLEAFVRIANSGQL
jgi:hypothetical protein